MSRPKKKARPEPSIFGRNLRRIRLQKKLSQTELARRMDLEPDSGRVYISRVEGGDVQWPAENARTFASALGVPLDELSPPEAKPVDDLEGLLELFKASGYPKLLKNPAFGDADLDRVRKEGRSVAVAKGANEETIYWLIQALRSTAPER